jgi:hypothetical protein
MGTFATIIAANANISTVSLSGSSIWISTIIVRLNAKCRSGCCATDILTRLTQTPKLA